MRCTALLPAGTRLAAAVPARGAGSPARNEQRDRHARVQLQPGTLMRPSGARAGPWVRRTKSPQMAVQKGWAAEAACPSEGEECDMVTAERAKSLAGISTIF